ncbi:hypothetical protein L9F63_001326 [Diploptera punctata]|uniref:Gustatory receptor n=1 Tax=Diploptera punctata TaxID=6984 RepID=A0AAD8A4B2_DIPPU|nr:hypothetical protein L9F63_001326 [Diploptera punctata]
MTESVNTLDVETDIKHINMLCKLLGLAPYKIIKNKFSGDDIIIDCNIRNNVILTIWSVVSATIMLVSIVVTIIHYTNQLSQSLSNNINALLCVPMFPTVAFVAILMNLTINKHKMAEFISKISYIDTKLNKLNRSIPAEKHYRFLRDVDIVIVLLVLLPFCESECWIWRTDDSLNLQYRSVMYSNIMDVAVMLQFCKCVTIIRKRLFELSLSVKQMYNPSSGTYELRCLLGEICKATSIINSMYGPLILLELIKMFLVLINFNLMIIYFNISISKAISLIAWKMLMMVEIIYIVVNCQLTVNKLRHLNQSVLINLCLKQRLKTEVFQQLTLFFNQISTCGLEFTACGLIKLDFSFLCSVLTSIVTFAIILLDFK